MRFSFVLACLRQPCHVGAPQAQAAVARAGLPRPCRCIPLPTIAVTYRADVLAVDRVDALGWRLVHVFTALPDAHDDLPSWDVRLASARKLARPFRPSQRPVHAGVSMSMRICATLPSASRSRFAATRSLVSDSPTSCSSVVPPSAVA